jgi:hypothetical protein
MRKPKPQIPTTKTPTWANPSGLDLNILISAKDAILWKQEQKKA